MASRSRCVWRRFLLQRYELWHKASSPAYYWMRCSYLFTLPHNGYEGTDSDRNAERGSGCNARSGDHRGRKYQLDGEHRRFLGGRGTARLGENRLLVDDRRTDAACGRRVSVLWGGNAYFRGGPFREKAE